VLKLKKIILSLLLLGAFGFAQSASAADRHAGYYYPEPQSFEVYTSSFDALPNNSKLGRVGFTVGLNTQQQKRAYAPTHHLFAKGANAQKLIIVSTEP